MKNNQVPSLFVGLFACNGISILGNAISDIAIPWLILEATGDPLYVSLVMAVKIIPYLWAAILGGKLIDKFGPIKISLYSDITNFVSILLIPILYSANLMNIYLMVFLVFLSSSLDSPGRTAKDVLVAREIDARNLENTRINGLASSVENICDILGPLLAGWLILAIGAMHVFYFDALTFLIPFFAIIFAKRYFKSSYASLIQNDEQDINKYSIRAGFKYLFSSGSLISLLLFSAILNSVISPIIVVYLPYTIKTHINDASSYGLILFLFGVGTTLASLTYSYLARFLNYKYVLSLCGLVIAILLSILPSLDTAFSLSIALFCIGFCIGFCGPIDGTTLQKLVAPEYQGRVFSIYGAARFLPVPIAMILYGWLLKTGNEIFLGYGVATFVLAGTILFGAMSFKLHQENITPSFDT